MKKYLLLGIVFSLVLFGCQKKNMSMVDVSAITDLSALSDIISQVSHEISDGILPMGQAQSLVNQLQQKYIDLTDNTYTAIEDSFDIIKKTLDEKGFASCGLPLWAKRAGMREPIGMFFTTGLSTCTTVNDSGYSSTILVYTGDYTLALSQAKIIATKAHLYVSKNFQEAQAIAKLGTIDYISGLDVSSLSHGIVYVNHELLDINPEQVLSLSVDQQGTLTIEATKYKE